MAIARSLASADALLKRYYLGGAEIPPDLIEDIEGPFSRMVDASTDTRFGGKGKAMLPVVTGLPANASHSYKTAYKNASTTKSDDYDIPAEDDFIHIFAEGKFLRLAKSNPDLSYIEARMIADSERAVRAFRLRHSYKPWSDRGGAVAMISADTNVATTTLKFVNRLAVHRMEKDQILEFSKDNGKTTPAAGVLPGQAKILKVNRKSGEITLNGNLSTLVPTVAPGDFVFMAGDYGKGWAGVLDWTPLLESEAITTLYGVDRSPDTTRYTGLRIPLPATEKPYTYLTELCRWSTEFNKRLDVVFTTPYELARLQLDISSRPSAEVQIGQTASIGYDNAMVRFPKMGKTLMVIADPFMAPPHIPETAPLYYGTSKKAWERTTAGPFSWLDEDGRVWRYVEGENILQAGYGGYGNYYCCRTDHCFWVGDETYVTDSP